ncbi:unnamed protein product [Didymodactylos carnosus]|uniref:LamG domain-containing protein n=1 Tax=Didymodactylos carnosus TaxID=1234261 RepID=A0A814V7V7_9BILA|nr:unnamed protein product [Didymodactylos carnosus]CAF1185373.1 unnamed protein product [Didymodactylos carnosus]CAF3730758.1 unnamed protein product [Didymodactylos carnosus]CAF3949654.1 unnamed protein product [Didymodactylos carnosus]
MTKNVLIGSGIVAGLVIVAAVVIPIAIIFSTNSVAMTTTTTTTAPVVLAYWNMEGNGRDLYGNYNASANGAGYTFASSGFYGGSYFSTNSLNSYLQVPASSYFDLNSRSFTFEAWIYSYSLTNDQPLFSQCTCTSCTNQCLFLVIRSSKLYMGFNFNDLPGSTTLSTSIWYHVAFVYNYQTSQQIIYLDGVQDAIRSNVSPYLGTNGSIYFSYSLLLPSNYYYGLIDNVQLTTRAKSTSEILNDATQVFYFSFDQPSPYYDNGPNGLNATTTSGLVPTSGHVGQALRWTSSSSYMQIYCFPGVGWPSSKSFTFAIWIYPSSITGGVLVYSIQGYSMLGLTYIGQIVGQLQQASPVNVWESIFGPFLQINTWTHVACTFSVTNGFILYVNGAAQGKITGYVTYYFNYNLQIIQLGTSSSGGNIPSYGYQGSMDELYAYRRELSSSEILALASV